jgi:hypothetical protein
MLAGVSCFHGIFLEILRNTTKISVRTVEAAVQLSTLHQRFVGKLTNFSSLQFQMTDSKNTGKT